jgi:hypothetical protein
MKAGSGKAREAAAAGEAVAAAVKASTASAEARDLIDCIGNPRRKG